MDNLYHELLLDLYRHPLNKKIPESYDWRHKEFNPLCGEEVELFLKYDGEKLVEIGWQGDGCALSQAGASVLTETAKGKNKTELAEMKADYILEQLGLANLNPTRQRCALLALKTLQK